MLYSCNELGAGYNFLLLYVKLSLIVEIMHDQCRQKNRMAEILHLDSSTLECKVSPIHESINQQYHDFMHKICTFYCHFRPRP